LPPQAAREALLEPSTAFPPGLALPSAPTCAFLLEAGWACLARRSSGGLQVNRWRCAAASRQRHRAKGASRPRHE